MVTPGPAVTVTGSAPSPISRETALNWLEQMMLIRRFEEAAEYAYTQKKIGGFLHLYIGEESIAVGAVAAMHRDDDIFTHYRDHGWVLARGGCQTFNGGTVRQSDRSRQRQGRFHAFCER